MVLRFCVAALLAVAADAAPSAVQWSRWELRLKDDAPWVVTFSGPAGRVLEVPVLRTSSGAVARVAFPAAGVWRWDGGSVRVSPYRGSNPLYRHGALKVADSKRYLAHADGTPFLWMGDTAWYAGVKATPDEWREYIADRGGKSFSVVQISAVRGPVPAGMQAPFDATGEPSDAYWDNIDAKVRHANEQGMVILMVGLGHPTNPADQAHVARPKFARYVAARFYGDHVIFSPNFDGRYAELHDTVAKNLRAATKQHLITQHPGTHKGLNEVYLPKSYLDFSGLQSGHHAGRLENTYGAAREWPLSLWSATPTKPVINIEGMYDGRGSDEGDGWREKDVRKIGWISWLSGALGYTYGAGETDRKVPESKGGVWGWNQSDSWDHWRKAAAWKSSAQMKILRDFFASLQWWKLEPAHNIVVEGGSTNQERAVAAAASDGSFVVVYTPVPQRLVLDRNRLGATLKRTWVNPATGARYPATSDLSTPDSGEDWVLLLERTRR